MRITFSGGVLAEKLVAALFESWIFCYNRVIVVRGMEYAGCYPLNLIFLQCPKVGGQKENTSLGDAGDYYCETINVLFYYTTVQHSNVEECNKLKINSFDGYTAIKTFIVI